MQVLGNIATPIQKRTARTGQDYYTFRLAESQGKDAEQQTTWYDICAFISELDADLLSKGQFVAVTGRLDVQAFMRKSGQPGASATVITVKIEHVIAKPKAAAGEPDEHPQL